jgi:integrase
MNIKDICELKHNSINGNSFFYVRAKTKTTKKKRVTKEVPITNSIKRIIEKRKNLKSEFLFGIINETDTPKEKHDKIHNFNKVIVKYFREFAKYAGLNNEFADQLGTYHARHSFATVAIRNGKSIALISEILHDGNLEVTQNYINTFPKEVFTELSNEMELSN